MRRLALLLLLAAGLGADEEVSTTLVRDARTKEPLAGVHVRRYEENAGASFVAARLLAEAVTDERGMASIPLGGRVEDCHWIFERPGYAVEETYGVLADAEVDLEPAGVLRGRLLDPFGEPCGGVAIEALLGCGHSPAVRRTRTDGDGRFVFEGVAPPVRAWFQAEGLAATYLELRDAGAEPVFVADPGVTVSGRVVGRDGRPVQGAVVRSLQQFRGPAAVTDAGGRFRLTGVVHHEALRAWGPDGDEAYVPEGFYEPGRELRIRLAPLWEDPPEVEELPVAIAVLEGTAPIPWVPVALCRLSDGRVFPAETGEDGIARIEAPRGRYDLRVGDATSSHVAPPARVAVEQAGGLLRIAAVRQPVLELAPGLPGDAGVELVLPDRLATIEGKTHLPAAGRAAVRVTLDGIVRVFPVGPLEDGRRRAGGW